MLVEFGALSIIGLQTFTTAIYQQFVLEFSNASAALLKSGGYLKRCWRMLKFLYRPGGVFPRMLRPWLHYSNQAFIPGTMTTVHG